jgi:hypothetical protein
MFSVRFSLSGIPMFTRYSALNTTNSNTVKPSKNATRLIPCVLLFQIAQHWEQLEQLELPGSVNSKGFLSNEVATVESYNTAESNHSPESQWSDNSGK